ncbi:MAG: hypothetical protein M3O28_06325 [Actinomycetota bacterium]|nr:hypothetical protein [Actinomycetota bacterium]
MTAVQTPGPVPGTRRSPAGEPDSAPRACHLSGSTQRPHRHLRCLLPIVLLILAAFVASAGLVISAVLS